MAEERNPMNVAEGFPLIDTVQIRSDATEVEGFTSYDALAGEEQIPFYTKRTRANVGLAYCNKDSTDALPFPYFIKSIGLQFLAPPAKTRIPVEEVGGGSTPADVAEWDTPYLFEKILPDHVGVTLKIKEDERLATVAIMAPPGYGALGADTGADIQAPVHGVTLSWPDLKNRFYFPKPLRVPRQSIVTVSLNLSKYAKRLVGAMNGPGTYALANHETDPITEKLIPRCGLIRCTLIGVREVQQRDEEHY